MDRPANGAAVAPKGAPNESDRSPAVPAQPQGTSMNSTSSTLHARTLLAHPLGASQHPHPAAGHAVLAACFKDLQPAVLVAVALVVQASTDGVGSLCPDLIHQPLRGSLRLQLPDHQWVPCRCVNGLTVEHQRVARVLTVVGNDQSSGHDRRVLSGSALQSWRPGTDRAADGRKHLGTQEEPHGHRGGR